MKPRLPYMMRRKQFIGLVMVGVLILALQIGFYRYRQNSKTETPDIEFVADKKTNILLSEFDPNELDEKQWKDLGFSEKQVKTILKYKDIVGGFFTSKAQLAKCYAISPEKFKELEPYVLLPEAASNNYKHNSYSPYKRKSLNINQKFNPNHYTEKDWEHLGFSEKQASAIIKYKNYLGGSFNSKEKFRECFIINEKNYALLAPFLILPEKEPEKANTKIATRKINYTYFDPNSLDINAWMKLGFSEKQAENILKYKNNYLKGSFKSLEDIKKCYMISEEKYEELKPWMKLSVRENDPKPNSANEAKTDFSKTDLNSITFNQLREFGFDEKSSASILGFRRALGGFAAKNQVLETYNLDKELGQKLANTINLSANITKYSLENAPEDFLKKHPYFKRYADKIIFLRVTYPSDKEIFKRLNIKPEDESKMKLYLK